MKIGKKIKFFRKKSNITQKELAEKIGVSASTVTKYENDSLEANYETLLKICDELDINIAELFEDNDNFISLENDLCSKLKNTKSLKELLELSFLLNESMSNKIRKSLNTQEKKDDFFNAFTEYINSYLVAEELRNMPWIEDDLDG